MTVQELIDELNEIEDKTLTVCIRGQVFPTMPIDLVQIKDDEVLLDF